MSCGPHPHPHPAKTEHAGREGPLNGEEKRKKEEKSEFQELNGQRLVEADTGGSPSNAILEKSMHACPTTPLWGKASVLSPFYVSVYPLSLKSF